MSFFALPPEINSLRMFIGAGTAPMLQAAAAWDGLAEELSAAANSFASVTSGLAGQAWQGAASMAMMNAAAPYAGWLSAAASQSAGAAGQARIVASLFEAARAATVLPQAIDANRNSFVQLVMSNLFGQNAPLIAMAEGIYEEMWAADVSAMAGYYSGASAVAAQVVPWASVLQGLPALGAGIASGMAGMSGGGTTANPGVGAGPVGAGAAGSDGATAGTENAAGSGAGASGGGVLTNGGAMYANGVGGDSAGNGFVPGDPSSGSAVQAGPPVTSNGAVGATGMGFVPVPIPTSGTATRAGLLGDGPVKAGGSAPSAADDDRAAAPPAPEAEVPAVEETTPEIGVLPTAAPEIAAKAAPMAVTRVQQSGGSSIPGSALRTPGAAKPQDQEAAETEEPAKPVPLRPESGDFRRRPKEPPGVQIRGG
ncbi:PPE family protein [Mycobacterium angelicum]|uniref:PPE domain-containing protein n=1 Tax=Mycobacterium angelicum TaxID=470074 RepID=A0A1X0A903_MYCAN|nr:PPE family protein [Mycobacterium angelicum]MCV7197504.1 PPE family protein [Mycobacterium angelicum]ORA26395.1 hypothetical protein BST12_00490 [Mycobacterium angelicum]